MKNKFAPVVKIDYTHLKKTLIKDITMATPDDVNHDIQEYLASIQSGESKYKRITLSPLRYAGGKSNAIGLILANFPKLKERRIVSPFFGGGSFEIVLSQCLGFEVLGYDIFGMLVNYWQQQISNPVGLANELANLLPNKEAFTHNRHILLHYWEKVKPSSLVYKTKAKVQLTDEEQTMLDNDVLKQAAYYFYNMQLSYGPMFIGWPSSIYMNEKKYKRIIENVRNFHAGNLRLECESFENVIANHKDDFLFCDPPYYLGEDSKMFKGMYPNCNFAIHHNNFDHTRLRDLLKQHKGGFFMTYNDCPTIREWYSEFKQVFPKWHYTYGQGERRIGKNRQDNKSNVKESHEIFIICPPLTP
jgi:DNA adenine methylase